MVCLLQTVESFGALENGGAISSESFWNLASPLGAGTLNDSVIGDLVDGTFQQLPSAPRWLSPCPPFTVDENTSISAQLYSIYTVVIPACWTLMDSVAWRRVYPQSYPSHANRTFCIRPFFIGKSNTSSSRRHERWNVPSFQDRWHFVSYEKRAKLFSFSPQYYVIFSPLTSAERVLAGEEGNSLFCLMSCHQPTTVVILNSSSASPFRTILFLRCIGIEPTLFNVEKSSIYS